MQTEWIWAAKANQAILTEKRSQKVWLKQDLLNRKHVYALLQRSRDIFFSLLAIIVLSPLMLLTALLIVLDDPHGGPIFSQYRVGKNGRKFKLYNGRSCRRQFGKLDATERDGWASVQNQKRPSYYPNWSLYSQNQH